MRVLFFIALTSIFVISVSAQEFEVAENVDDSFSGKVRNGISIGPFKTKKINGLCLTLSQQKTNYQWIECRITWGTICRVYGFYAFTKYISRTF